MEAELDKIENGALAAVMAAGDAKALEDLRVLYLGKKGALTGVLKGLGALPDEERRRLGARANTIKEALGAAIEARRKTLAQQAETLDLGRKVDLTLPGDPWPRGSVHPISRVIEDLSGIFSSMGFEVVDGPELETDFYNFEALNIPKYHPARETQDSFYIGPDLLMRTQTSNVQIHVMQRRRPPLRVVSAGRVYRRDDDVTHSPMFFQMEGLYVDTHVTFANLKAVLTAFVQRVFGQKRQVRFRPSFFPFTEPSAEVDMDCPFCDQKGCRICKDGWVEILGSGMVHPNVFRAVGYDAEKYTGFAFGLGVDRIAMLKYRIPNIRLLYEGDVRFLSQF